MLKDIVYLFKTNEEWFVLRNKIFSFREIGKKGITHCNYSSLQITCYGYNDKFQQVFIHIPALQKTFFLSFYEYPDIEEFYLTLRSLKEKNKNLVHKYRRGFD
jgi:hypothetical protein